MSTNLETLRKALELLRDQPDQLVAIILRQVERFQQQAERIAQLEAEVESLKQRLEELEQKPAGSVAPFRIEEHKRAVKPKRPGRKKGHAGSYRQRPELTETATVALETCPHCGGAVTERNAVEQVIEEIPEAAVRVVGLTTFTGRCAQCGLVRSSHPLQVSTAMGAAGVHLGPQALSIVLQLQHRWHLSKRKSCQLLKELFGLSLTPGGLVAASHRLAKRLEKPYQALSAQARQAAVLHSDETGWYVGAPGHTLWVFTNPRLTLYRVVASRSRHELQQTVGSDFAGVLISDCLNIYDNATPLQHKCYGHHLKAITTAMAQHPAQGAGFLTQVRDLLKTAMSVKARQEQTSAARYAKWCQRLEEQAAALLPHARADPLEEVVRRRLYKQRDHLFTFLYYDGVEATNNLAERQLRPAVIARKLGCGNRTQHGAHTWEVLASLAVTCAQRGQSFAELISQSLTTSPLNALAQELFREMLGH